MRTYVCACEQGLPFRIRTLHHPLSTPVTRSPSSRGRLDQYFQRVRQREQNEEVARREAEERKTEGEGRERNRERERTKPLYPPPAICSRRCVTLQLRWRPEFSTAVARENENSLSLAVGVQKQACARSWSAAESPLSCQRIPRINVILDARTKSRAPRVRRVLRVNCALNV